MSQLCPNCEAPAQTLALLGPPPAASPNLTHLLTSNEPPLESEVPFIQKVIADGQGRIQPLDEEIGSLEAQIHDLQAALFQFQSRRDEVAESVRRHQAVISPIRRVPAELICEIFLLASSTDDGVNKPPWYLGHICRSWRDSALAYPALWISLTVDVDSSVSRTMSRLRAQLLRSAIGPLDIHWRCDHPSLLDLLLPHSTRWRNLCFDDCEFKDFEWLQSVYGCLDRLQKVHVAIPAANRYAFPDVFLTARNLRAVMLTDGKFFLSQTIAIPWEQISHYHGTYSPARQLEILRAAASTLVECVIGFTGDDFDDEPPHNLTLPNLRRLSSEYVAILPHLKAPILEELRLIFGHEPMTSLYPFIHRSSCTLTRLALIQCQIDSELISLLRSLPTLSSLLLDLEYDMYEIGRSDWIVAMSMSGAPTDICPSLTTFEFGYKSATQIVWDVFVAMARSRFHTHSSSRCRLSRLRLFAGRSSSSDNVAAHIATLRNDGFDAVLLDRDDMSKSLF
ncbi:hypothetical protein DFH06DRAFT_1476276 [Mycena polygramma]|nr:hypothetical protein DFH06DRAFT_1476276 [Mycena polygramma]